MSLKKLKKQFKGLSLKLSDSFFHNLVIVFGVVLVWRGIWNLTDLYILPNHHLLSNIISITIGIGMLYLIDGTIKELGHCENDNKNNKHKKKK